MVVGMRCSGRRMMLRGRWGGGEDTETERCRAAESGREGKGRGKGKGVEAGHST